MKRIAMFRGLASLLLTVCGTVQAADWGDLTAKFVLDGAAPAPAALQITKDQEVCGKHNLVDESLVVNPTNKGIANVVVYLYLARGEKAPAVHDSYKEAASKPVVLDNDKCRFAPHIVAVRTKQTLLVGNKDSVGHNTNVTTLRNPPQNVLIPANGELKMVFNQEESLPSPVACNIHPWMKGHLVIKEHPYVGVSDENGNVTIKNLPAGSWTFQVWQEAAGYVTEANQGGKPAKWERGRVKLTIKSGANDLGEIKLQPAIFQKK
ncbi:MAG: hypothetical protein AB7F89_04545 [Pirellulaceae bacterium]